MHPDSTMQLAAIRQDELRQSASPHRAPSARRRSRIRTRWARRTIRE